jgi:hypothetical protein
MLGIKAATIYAGGYCKFQRYRARGRREAREKYIAQPIVLHTRLFGNDAARAQGKRIYITCTEALSIGKAYYPCHSEYYTNREMYM